MKMKKIISILLVVCLCLTVFAFPAYAATSAKVDNIIVDNKISEYITSKDGLWRYQLVEHVTTSSVTKEYYVFEYLGTDKDITLPGEIDGIVPTICTMGYNDDIESITIPENYEYTYDFAFAGCDNLKKVVFEKSLTYVHLGSCTFSGCKKLKTVVLPQKLKNEEIWNGIHQWRWAVKLPDDCFYNCKKLKNITLPDNLTEIGGEAFCGCSSLEEFVIPDGVKIVGQYAFENCSSLKTLTFPESVTEQDGFITEYSNLSQSLAIIANPNSGVYESLQETIAYLNEKTDSNFSLISSIPSEILGDTNNDGLVDVTDVTLLQKVMAEIYTLTLDNADVDGNEKIDINDATAIQRIIANITL